MTALVEQTITVDGIATRLLRGGAKSIPLVFLHGGTPGLTPYCSGAHVWGPCLERFAGEFSLVALDLPGSGGTPLTAAGLTIDAMAAHVRATLRALAIDRCHLIGHDTGGLVALMLACDEPELALAVSAVSSAAAAPSGDGVDQIALAHPLTPLWQRRSQRAALESVSYSHQHIDDGFLDACVAAASLPPHAEALARIAQGANAETFIPSVMKAKSRLFEICRNQGVPVPAQVIWGTHDPLATLDRGLWLFRLLAQKQSATHFHAINRTGALPFREDPQAFHQVVAAFHDGIAIA
jgi:pimeloyl-ACP methyl ester carboxylesterase